MRRILAIVLTAITVGLFGNPAGQFVIATAGAAAGAMQVHTDFGHDGAAALTETACTNHAASPNPAQGCDPSRLCIECNACHACHQLVVFSGATSPSSVYLPQLHPSQLAPNYRSAESAPSFKPPIS
ncbi:MAG: hypothetical protein IPK34_09085 [Ramlibacter sp.]|jgi:hypothetical protein|nr:hypothetical protein [Ramlibacter sp.]